MCFSRVDFDILCLYMFFFVFIQIYANQFSSLIYIFFVSEYGIICTLLSCFRCYESIILLIMFCGENNLNFFEQSYQLNKKCNLRNKRPLESKKMSMLHKYFLFFSGYNLKKKYKLY